MKNLPKLFSSEVRLIFSMLENKARLVGGCVRDFILYEKIVEDIDIATPFLPEQVMEKLSSKFNIIPTGLKHGTVTIIGQELCEDGSRKKYEITTLRHDKETDGRHAEVSFDASWEEDSARRDFTMNALYLDIEGNLYDYHNGLADLDRQIVQFINDPEKRIEEDYLRILRFFRFAMRFGAYDEASLNACLNMHHNLVKISKERVAQEWFKILDGKYFYQFQNLIKPILKTIKFKDIAVNDDQQKLTKLGITSLFWQPDSFIHLSNAEKLYIKNLQTLRIENQTDALILFKKYGTDFVHDKMILENKHFDVFVLPDMPVNGADMMILGYSGQKIGQVLNRLEYIWVDKLGNISKDELLTIASKEENV